MIELLCEKRPTDMEEFRSCIPCNIRENLDREQLKYVDDMARSLKPGGIMIHRVDLRDHGMFAGHHPLTLLTLSDGLHRRITEGAGRPNRVLAPVYRAWLARAGLTGGITATADLAMAAAQAELALLVIPAQHLRAVTAAMAPSLRGGTPVAICAKGIEVETEALMSEILAETLPENRVEDGDRKRGFITSGTPYNYVKEAFPEAAVLKLGMIWPLPEKMIRNLLAPTSFNQSNWS